MISSHKIQILIDEMRDISKTDMIVYTPKGKPAAYTSIPEKDTFD